MSFELKKFFSTPVVTNSPVKQELFLENGGQIVGDKRFTDVVSIAEGKQLLIQEDNDAEYPFVLKTADIKARELANYLGLISTFGGTRIPALAANDSVWNFSYNHETGRIRTIVNKPETEEDFERIKGFYKEAVGTLSYSSAALCIATPNPFNPVPLSLFTKLRLGYWVGNVPDSFTPNPKFSLGMDAAMALSKGHIQAIDGMMKFEAIVRDDTSDDNMRVQQNYEMRLPFNGTPKNFYLIKALSHGVIPPEIFSRLQLVKEKQYHRQRIL